MTTVLPNCRRLVQTIRPLLEGYAATCHCVRNATQKEVVGAALDSLLESFAQNKMLYGEAVSTDAIRNCLRLLRQWGVIEMYTDNRERKIRVCTPYENRDNMEEVCANIYKFNMATPVL
ncbi:jg11388 [Pararge aegeria aegeria]|uniref:Jg11388 protein n=1 Tax=Pararge aegeria aegeria TaxID=348720 RepID=A0A8S4QUB1_9NEOP|nr:jg11388 [Pararge aegeria aegeria]